MAESQTGKTRANLCQFDPFVLDLGSAELLRAGKPVKLAALPARLLRYLAANRHRTVSKHELAQELWGGRAIGEATLHQAVRAARHAVDDDGRQQRVIRTASGIGYRFVAKANDSAPVLHLVGATSYVGQRSLLAELEQALSEVKAGRGALLLLEGEPGIGKSRAIDEIARLAGGLGLSVVSGGASPQEGAPPFWPWIEVFRGLAGIRPVADLRADAPHLLKAGAELTIRPSEPSRFRQFKAAARCLERSAEHGAIAVLLEDLHEAGAATLELLEFVAQRALHAPLLMVATYRERELREDPARSRVLDRLVEFPGVRARALTPMSDVEIAYLVEQHSGRIVPLDRVRSLCRHTAGNPFFAVEIARVLPDDTTLADESAWEDWLPRGATELLTDRLVSLGVENHALLVTAAAIGTTFDAALLARSEADSETRRALAVAVTQHLISELEPGSGSYRFTHALIREALYAELGEDPALRGRIHLRIADAIARFDPMREAEVAHHLCEAGAYAGSQRIAAAIERAAERAARSGDLGGAFALYERGLGVLAAIPDASGATRCGLLVAAGELGVRGVAPDKARALLDEAVGIGHELGLRELLARAVLAKAYRAEIVGVADTELLSLLDEAIAGLAGERPALAAQLLSRSAIEVRYADDGVGRATDMIERATRLSLESGDAHARAQVLEDTSLVRWSLADPHAWIDLNHRIVQAASEAGDTELVFQGLKGLAAGHLELGNRSGFDDALERCAATAEEYPSPFLRAVVSSLHAARDFVDGALETGEASAIAAAASGLDAVAPLATAQLFYHRLETGRLLELEAPIRQLVRDSPGIAAWQGALARLLVDAGRHDEARALLDSIAPLETIATDRNWFPAMAMLSECAARLEDVALAQRILDLLAPHARHGVVLGNGALFYGMGAHYLGMLCRVTGKLDDAKEQLEAAAEMHAAMRSEPWVLRTRVEEAETQFCLGDVSEAQRLAEASAVRATELGMVRCAEHAQQIGKTRPPTTSRPRTPS
jgi:DNA-binding winged helix-turn-helix (wHTH) protein